MRRLIIALLLAVAVIVQMTVLPAIRPFGVVPNLVLVLIVLISLYSVTTEALLGAIFSGFLLDLTSGSNFGLWMGVLMLSALVVGLMHRAGLELNGTLAAAILVATGTLIMTIVIWLALISITRNWLIPLSMVRMLTTELVLNLVIMLLLRRFMRWALVRRGSGF